MLKFYTDSVTEMTVVLYTVAIAWREGKKWSQKIESFVAQSLVMFLKVKAESTKGFSTILLYLL